MKPQLKAVLSVLIALGGGLRAQEGVESRLEGLGTVAGIVQAFGSMPAGDVAGIRDFAAKKAEELFKGERYAAAIPAYRVVLAAAVLSKLDAEAARLYRRIGVCQFRQGLVAEALKEYEEGLVLAERAGDKAIAAELLRGIGTTSHQLGNIEGSLAAANRSLALYREMGNLREVAGALNNLAVVYGDAGDSRKKNETLEECIRTAEAAGAKDMAATALWNLGVTYLAQQDNELALHAFTRALEVQPSKTKRDIGKDQMNLAVVYRRLGRQREADEALEKSIAASREIGDRSVLARGLVDKGIFARDRGRMEECERLTREAVEILAGGSLRDLEGAARANLALGLLAAGKYEEAYEEGRKAEAIARQRAGAAALWEALESVGPAALKMGRKEEAKAVFLESAAMVEKMRGNVFGGSGQAQHFLFDKLTAFHGLLAMAVEEGDMAQALQMAERAKARQLGDAVRNTPGWVFSPLSPAEQAEERRVEKEASAAETRMERNSDPKKAEGLRVAWQRAVAESETLRVRLMAAHPELRIQRAELPAFTVEVAERILPETGAVLLDYVVGAEGLYVLALHRNANGRVEVAAKRIGASRSSIEKQAEQFRQSLAGRQLGYKAHAAALYRTLLGPVEGY